MTRCCASFANCSPEVVPVTIVQTTNNFVVNGDQIAWRQELFEYADIVAGALVGALQSVVHSTSGATLKALHAIELDREPQSAQTLQVSLNGSSGTRPLISYSVDNPAGSGYDFFVDGDVLYLNFTPAAGESVYVQYVGVTLPGDPTATALGSMDVVESTTTPTHGWILADGATPYSSVAYSRLYAWLDANGNGILLKAGDSTENYDDGQVSFVVPPGSFVVRYLDPSTFAAMVDPASTVRSSTHRVQIKA